MALILDGTTGIVANNISSTSRLAVGNMATGSVLQVVSSAITDAQSYSVASGATQAITGLSVSITPSSASSKIIILASVSLIAQNVGSSIQLLRGATAIGIGDASASRTRVSSGSVSAVQNLYSEMQNPTVQFLDSPATTSSTTYSISIFNARSSTDTLYVNRSINDGNNSYMGRYMSSITVMEIAQ